MPKIMVEYEVTKRYSFELDVPPDALNEMDNECSLKPLEKYGLPDEEELAEQAWLDGWTETDWCVTDDRGEVLIPWEME